LHPESRHPSPSLIAVAAAFAAIYLIWGSTYLAIRFAIETLPPFLMAGARFLVAGAILYPIARSRARAEPLGWRHWRAAALIGGLMLVGGNGLVCWAEQYVASGIAALLIATVPLWMVLLDWLVYRGARPTPWVVAGLITGLAGVYLLIGRSTIGGEPVHLAGGLALLVACLFWSLGSLQSRRTALPKSAFLSTAMQMLAGGAIFMVIGTAIGEWPRVAWQSISLKSTLALGYLIVFGALVALSAYVWLLGNVTAARVSTYAYVNPVIAVFLGAVLGGEVVSARTGLAAGVIVAAVVMITTGSRKRRPAGVPPGAPLIDAADAEAAESESDGHHSAADKREGFDLGRAAPCVKVD
jgi:drug/metabolite transporter (DMT)-like permease